MPLFFNVTRACLQKRASLLPQATFALLCFLFVIEFFQLSTLDIQPYDEGYYALRAKAIAQFGCWFNQADYAIGGFYSASHPPLHIWLMTICTTLFGLSEFTLRLPSLLMFALFLLFITRHAARSALPHTPLYTLLVCGFLPILLWYARLAHLDTTLMLFSFLEAHFYLRYLDTRNRLFVLLSGLMLGAALLSKVLVGIFPALAIALLELYRMLTRRTTCKDALAALLLFFGIGLTLGLSWFAWLCISNEGYLQRYLDLFIFDRIQRNQTLSQYRTGAFYYLNVSLTRFPLSAISILWLWSFWRNPEFRTPYRMLWLIWFVLTFLILSVAQTKLLWYALLFLPPLTLITAEALAMLQIALQAPVPSRSVKLTLWGLLIASVWSLTQCLHRELVEAILSHQWSELTTVAILLISISSLGALGWWLFWRFSMRSILLYAFILVLGFVFALNTALHGLAFVQLYTGGKTVGAYVQRCKPSCLIHLVPQKRFDEQSFNPQLSYYLNGLDVDASRWGLKTRYVYLPLSDTMRLATALLASHDALLVVEKTARTRPRLGVELINEFEATAQRLGAQQVLDTPNYTVYAWHLATDSTASTAH
ncbi:MAG: ArnT family glycosyltransferase [Candidatus Thermochlorobacter sp.]